MNFGSASLRGAILASMLTVFFSLSTVMPVLFSSAAAKPVSRATISRENMERMDSTFLFPTVFCFAFRVFERRRETQSRRQTGQLLLPDTHDGGRAIDEFAGDVAGCHVNTAAVHDWAAVDHA